MIGIFDSGVGGLCALAAAKEAMPHADFLYFADTANLPYGEKSPEVLMRLARRAISLLIAEGADCILAACGTVSAAVLPRLEDCPVPLYGVLRPAAEAAAKSQAAKGGDILLLGTRGTLESGVFSAEILRFATHAPLHTLPCPFLVRLAESGHININDNFAAMCVPRILAPVRGYDIRTVVLGCTHFSHLAPHICRELPHAAPIDAAREAARALALSCRDGTGRGRGEIGLLTSGSPAHLTEAARRLMPSLKLTALEVRVPAEY